MMPDHTNFDRAPIGQTNAPDHRKCPKGKPLGQGAARSGFSRRAPVGHLASRASNRASCGLTAGGSWLVAPVCATATLAKPPFRDGRVVVAHGPGFWSHWGEDGPTCSDDTPLRLAVAAVFAYPRSMTAFGAVRGGSLNVSGRGSALDRLFACATEISR